MTTSSPSASTCDTIRSPLTKTPLRLRSSSTRTPSSSTSSTAWRRETVGSSKRSSADRLRPMRTGAPAAGVVEEKVAGGLLERRDGGVDHRVAVGGAPLGLDALEARAGVEQR